MKLKDRLTSTENLLRSIRGGEASSSKGAGDPAGGSIWTRRISMRDVFSGLMGGRKGEPAPQPPRPTPQAPRPTPQQVSQPRPAPTQPAAPATQAAPRVAAPQPAPASAPAQRTAQPQAQPRPSVPPQRPEPAPTARPQQAAPPPPPPPAQQPPAGPRFFSLHVEEGLDAESPGIRMDELGRSGVPRAAQAPRPLVEPAPWSQEFRQPEPAPQQPARRPEPQEFRQPEPAPQQPARRPEPQKFRQPEQPRPAPARPAASRPDPRQEFQPPRRLAQPAPAPKGKAARLGEMLNRPLFQRKQQEPAPKAGTSGPGVPLGPLTTPAVAVDAKAAKPAESFWSREIRLGRNGKAYCLGVSFAGVWLCLTVVRNTTGYIVVSRRYPMGPDQQPGERGFPTYLKACIDSLGLSAANLDVWAVLRSPDLDLNVLTVPKLSGAKLDAAVYWTLQKEKKFAEAEYILDYLTLGQAQETRESKLSVLTCLARRADVERLREAFREAGHPLSGVTAIPNALLTLYRMPRAPKGYSLAANIHVECDFSAIGLYTNDRLLFSRFIRSGAGSMAESLVEHFRELSAPRHAILDDMELPLGEYAVPDTFGGEVVTPLDSGQAQALLRHVLLGAPRPTGVTAAHLMSPQKMLEVLAPAIERLARQVERTLDYFASSQHARCDVLHLSGEIFGSPDIMQALATQLGFPPVAFDSTLIAPGGAELVLPSDRMIMAPSLAAALAPQGKGMNLLHNYKARTAQESKRLATSTLVLGLAAVLLIIGGAGYVLDRANSAKRQDLQRLQGRIAALGPSVDEKTLMASMSTFKLRQDALREASARLLAPAALAEISRLAPESVKIVSLTASYPAAAPTAPAAPAAPAAAAPAPGAPAQATPAQKPAAPMGNLVLEGVVGGPRSEQDATLSRFVISLQSSPMFSMPVVDESSLRGVSGSSDVLHFTMHLGVK